MGARWGDVVGLQWIQVEDLVSPDVRDEPYTWKWGCYGRWVLLTLMSVGPDGDGWEAAPDRHKRTSNRDNSMLK